eukprot:gene35371-47530_t
MAENGTSKPTYKIFSFYNQHVNPAVPKYQKAVFNYFGFEIEHVVNGRFNHGDFLNYVCRHTLDVDYIIIFDIDCIPIHKNWIEKLLQDLAEPRTIAGAAQTANHLQEGKNLYVSPFFFGISTSYLKELDYPDMNLKPTMDAGQNLTEQVIKNGGDIKYWWPTDIEEEKAPNDTESMTQLDENDSNTIFALDAVPKKDPSCNQPCNQW